MTVPRENATLSDSVRALLQERIDRDLVTVTELARRLGFARSTVSRWLNGKSQPSVGLVDAAAAYVSRTSARRP